MCIVYCGTNFYFSLLLSRKGFSSCSNLPGLKSVCSAHEIYIHIAAINSVLFYMVSAREFDTEHCIVTICLSFYWYKKIYKAKDLLRKATGDLPLPQSAENEARSHITDTMDISKKFKEQVFSLLKSLSDSHAEMPPTSGSQLFRNIYYSYSAICQL